MSSSEPQCNQGTSEKGDERGHPLPLPHPHPPLSPSATSAAAVPTPTHKARYNKYLLPSPVLAARTTDREDSGNGSFSLPAAATTTTSLSSSTGGVDVAAATHASAQIRVPEDESLRLTVTATSSRTEQLRLVREASNAASEAHPLAATTTYGGTDPTSEPTTSTTTASTSHHHHRSASEHRRDYALWAADRKSVLEPRFTGAHGSTFAVPAVHKAQLPTVLGTVGAVRRKGCEAFTPDAPPPALVVPRDPTLLAALSKSGAPVRRTGSALAEGSAHEGTRLLRRHPSGLTAELPTDTISGGGGYGGVKNDSILSTTSSHHLPHNVVLMDGKQAPALTVAPMEEDDDEYEVLSHAQAAGHLIPFVVPATVALALTMLITVMPLFFIGNHLGEEALNGASVGYFLLSMTAVYPIQGMMFALDTLCSHEYGRDPDSDGLGLLLQRGLLVGIGFLIPICLFFFGFAEHLMLGLYGPQVAAHASEFIRFSPLFLFPLVCFTAFSKFLANQMLPHLPMLATLVGVACSTLFQHFFVDRGLVAVMLGMTAACWIQLATIVSITFWLEGPRRRLGTLRLREALRPDETWAYLKIAIPSAIFVAMEVSAFDASIMVSAGVSEAAGSAWSALLSYEMVIVDVAGGISAAACAKVGAAVGANQPINARTYAYTALYLSFFWAFCISVPGIVLCFPTMVEVFGGNPEESAKVRTLFPIMHVVDAIQFTFQGIFGGANLNDLGARLLMGALWGVGFPLSMFLAFGWAAHVASFLNRLFGTTITLPTVAPPSPSPSARSRHLPAAHSTATATASHGPISRLLSAVFTYLLSNWSGIRGAVAGLIVGLALLGPLMIRAMRRLDWDAIALQAQLEASDDDMSSSSNDNRSRENDDEQL